MTGTTSPITTEWLSLPADIRSAAETAVGHLRPLTHAEILLIVGRAIKAEREKAAQLERAVEFSARWAWREDPPHASRKLTDGERLSAIKYHPTIKAIWHPPSPQPAAVSEGGEDE